jgi:chemotaxis protein CheD
VRQSAEARAERLAAARKRVELFSTPAATRPKVELFGAPGAGGSAGTGASKSRIELFGTSSRPINPNNARTTEEA